MNPQTLRSVWAAPLTIALLGIAMLSSCSSAKGTCTNQTGTQTTTLGTNVTESECRQLCQDQLQRDDCDWVETSGAARIVGPSDRREP